VKLLLSLMFLILVISTPVLACNESKVGYWWYCEPEVTEEQTEAQPSQAPQRSPLPPPPPHQAMMQMHPDDIQTLQNDYLKQAIWKTTPEHVFNYYQVLDVARKKSLAFTSVANLVLLENPKLNAWGQYQKTAPARKALTQYKTQQVNSRLFDQKEFFGLILFTRADCPFCQSQQQVLSYFSEKYGWPVKVVGIDRAPAMASRFNVSYVPLTILVHKNSDQWMPIAVGEEALTTIETNIYRAIRYLSGETSADQFLQMEHQDGSVLDPGFILEAKR